MALSQNKKWGIWRKDMKSLMPWVCVVAAANITCANASSIDDYRQGKYMQAAQGFNTNERNSAVGNYYLGKMYLYGYGVLKNNDLAIEYFEKAGEAGNLRAQNFLARYELNYKKDPKRAFYWFKKAADKGDNQARLYCIGAYFFGYGVNKYPDKARTYYLAAAKEGNPLAQLALGEHFLDSRSRTNQRLGVLWLEKAAEQGNEVATIELASLYEKGSRYIDKDISQAKELLKKVKDNPKANFLLGKIAVSEGDYDKAKQLLIKSADAKNADAAFALSEMYLDEKSPIHNDDEGFLWTLKAAQGGNKDAAMQLSKLYTEGVVVKKDDALAEGWAKRAKKAEEKQENPELDMALWLSGGKSTKIADSGYRLKGILTEWENPKALAQNNYNQSPKMEFISRESIFKPEFVMTKPNSLNAGTYYDIVARTMRRLADDEIVFKSYELDNVLLSFLYPVDVDATGKPITRDINPNSKEVFDELYEQAIHGNSQAQFALGLMYEQGVYVQKDLDKAMKYYFDAANQNDLRAQYQLGIIFLEGKGVEPDYDLAFDLFTDSAYQGNLRAQFALAELYEQGYQDKEGKVVFKAYAPQAIGLYYLSSANGYGPALYRLAEILVREKPEDMTVATANKRHDLIKSLYKRALAQGIKEAELPLAFFDADTNDKAKQQRAYKVAEQFAHNGNKLGSLFLGLLYDRGVGVAKDRSEAIYWYKESLPNPAADFILGTYYGEGKSVSKDPEYAKNMLQKAASLEFSYANLNLAILEHGSGEDFVPELNRAMELGNSRAGLLLADYYLAASSDPENMRKARGIYEEFAKKGARLAELKLGVMYEHGLGGAVNLKLSQDWYQKASEQGEPVAQFLLGNLYQMGQVGDAPNYRLAKFWYQKAEQKLPKAAVALGFVEETVFDDYKKAKQSYQLAAAKGNNIGKYNLALVYDYGKGEPVNVDKARELLQDAAEHGNQDAMTILGSLYLKGDNGHSDLQYALMWYKKAAAAGSVDALYQLGLFFETGVATSVNIAEALSYYEKAAAKGDSKAKLALARMYQYGLGVSPNKEVASSYYKELANKGNPYAQLQLASFYYAGLTGKPEPEQGFALLQKAQRNGSEAASKLLLKIQGSNSETASYIEPITIEEKMNLSAMPVNMLYMQALNEWNEGNAKASQKILDKIRLKFPSFEPAKRAVKDLQDSLSPKIVS